MPVPPENPITETKRVLGKILFWDEQLSHDNTIACGTCHIPASSGAEPRMGLNPGFDSIFGNADDVLGSPGVIRADANDDYESDPEFGLGVQVTRRNSQGFIGTQWAPQQFWDGRAESRFLNPETGAVSIASGGALENQAVGPPVSDVEMAHELRSWDDIRAKLQVVDPLRLATSIPPDMASAISNGESYPDLFLAAFGDSAITGERIAHAIATYERTLVPDDTPWDRFMAGDATALTAQQRRGWTLLNDHTICLNCHTAPLFTDNQFHNIGLRPWREDPGLMETTTNFRDRGLFKTPSLRGVGLRNKLAHVGWITDVQDMIDFYTAVTLNTGHTQFPENQDRRISRILMPTWMQPAIIDFLENGLTDTRVANETFPFDRPTLHSEAVVANPETYGQGSTGSGGVVPSMIAVTPLNLNNPAFKLGIASGLGGAPAAIVLSLGRSNPGAMLGQIPLHIDLNLIVLAETRFLAGAAAGEGYATWSASLGNDASLIGASLYGQWLVIDPQAPDGIASSDGARWTVF